MIDPNSPVTAAALEAWFASAELPNAHRMAAALNAGLAEGIRQQAKSGLFGALANGKVSRFIAEVRDEETRLGIGEDAR